MQAVFRFFCYWAVNGILDGVDLIHSRIKLQWIPKPSRLWSRLEIVTCKKKQNIIQAQNKKMERINPKKDLKMWSHIV